MQLIFHLYPEFGHRFQKFHAHKFSCYLWNFITYKNYL